MSGVTDPKEFAKAWKEYINRFYGAYMYTRYDAEKYAGVWRYGHGRGSV